MKKFVISMTAGMAIATTALVPKTAQAHVGWKDTYYCDEYTITLNEYAREEYSYSARSGYGNIYLINGSSQNGGNSWIYNFSNGKTNYELEDPWNSQTAYLRVYKNGRPILKRSCQK